MKFNNEYNTDRSFLYGRLISVYEAYEHLYMEGFIGYAFNNFEKIKKRPESYLIQLEKEKLNIARFILKKDIESYNILEEELQNIKKLINDKFDTRSEEYGKSLGPGYIFGYEAENRDLINAGVKLFE